MQNQLVSYIVLLIRSYFKRNFSDANAKDDLIDDLGLDPLDVNFLIIKIENEFKIYIFIEEFEKIRTIFDIANLIIEKKKLIPSYEQ